jgi:HAD superfamily hydrolase (TIGR01509 family)
MEKPMQAVDVLLFDLGGVLVEWDGTTPLMALTGGRLDRESARRFWLDSPWVSRHDTGACTVEEFASGALKELQLDMPRDAFIEVYRSWVQGPFPGAEALLERLTASGQFRLASLTNNNQTHYERITHELDLGRYFSQVFASHLIHRKKPDPEVYRYVTEQLDVAPERIAFFDDNPECLKPGHELGWKTFHTIGIKQLEAALRQLGAI